MIKFILAFALAFSPTLGYAQLNDYSRQELSYVNVLAAFNGGFESGTAKWTASGGTFAAVTSGSNLLEGKGSTTWNSNGAAQTLTSQAVTVKNGYFGRNCEASIVTQTPSGTATHLVQSWDGSNVLASATIVSSTLPRAQTVTFPCPQSGTFALRLLSVNADEPLIALDEGYLGLARNVGVADLQTPWTAFTPSGSWVSNTTYTGLWRQVGPDYHFRVRAATSGAPTATALTINYLISGISIDTSKLLSTSTNGGSPIAACKIIAAGSNYESSGYYNTNSLAPTVGAATGSYTNGVNVNATIPGTFTSGDSVECVGKVPILGWAASTVVMPNAQGLSWSGTHSNDCSWTTTSTSLAAIGTGDASCTFTQLSNRNFGTVASATASSNNIPGIVFTPVVSGKYFVCATAHAYNASAVGNFVGLAIHDGTSIISSSSRRNGAASSGTNDEIPFTMCGIATLSAGASRTVQLYASASAGTTTLAAGASGAALVTWSIFNIDQPVQAILANSVSSASINGTYFNSAQVGSTGTVTKETGDWISGSCSVSTAVATCTLVAGAFSTDPACHATIFGETTSYNAVVTSATTSTVVVRTFDTANAAAAAAFSLTCSSPR